MKASECESLSLSWGDLVAAAVAWGSLVNDFRKLRFRRKSYRVEAWVEEGPCDIRLTGCIKLSRCVDGLVSSLAF